MKTSLLAFVLTLTLTLVMATAVQDACTKASDCHLTHVVEQECLNGQCVVMDYSKSLDPMDARKNCEITRDRSEVWADCYQRQKCDTNIAQALTHCATIPDPRDCPQLKLACPIFGRKCFWSNEVNAFACRCSQGRGYTCSCDAATTNFSREVCEQKCAIRCGTVINGARCVIRMENGVERMRC